MTHTDKNTSTLSSLVDAFKEHIETAQDGDTLDILPDLTPEDRKAVYAFAFGFANRFAEQLYQEKINKTSPFYKTGDLRTDLAQINGALSQLLRQTRGQLFVYHDIGWAIDSAFGYDLDDEELYITPSTDEVIKEAFEDALLSYLPAYLNVYAFFLPTDYEDYYAFEVMTFDDFKYRNQSRKRK